MRLTGFIRSPRRRGRRHDQGKRLGSLQIDDQLEFSRLEKRRFGAFENLINLWRRQCCIANRFLTRPATPIRSTADSIR
jgi:hypothetical protein